MSISAKTDHAAELELEKLKELEFCKVHLTHIPSYEDESVLIKD